MAIVIPLMDDSAEPDGWHNVASPGGYEWWYFDAEDRGTGTHLVAIFLDGFVFHPGYLRSYARYRMAPTRHAPPMPRDYPCCYFAVYRGGRLLHQFMTQFAPGALRADPKRLDVTLGRNRVTAGAGEGPIRVSLHGTPWVLTARGPRTLVDRALTAELTFTPRFTHPPVERRFLSREMTGGADHQWVLVNPVCEVSGSVRIAGVEESPVGSSSETFEFSGSGYHDHNYGTAPIGHGLKRWFWGRALLNDSAVVFHYAMPRDPALQDEAHVIEYERLSVSALSSPLVQLDWSGKTALALRYPRAASLGGLTLWRPRVIDSAPFYMRIEYDAQYRPARSGSTSDAQRSGTALCEVAYPHRLRWPVLGRMIEMSIDKRAVRPLS